MSAAPFRLLDFVGAVRAADLPGVEKATLVWLATYTNAGPDSEEHGPHGTSFVGLEKLAKASGFSRATVLRAIGNLVRAGWLERKRNGRTLSNSYRPLQPGVKYQSATSLCATSLCATGEVSERDGVKYQRDTLSDHEIRSGDQIGLSLDPSHPKEKPSRRRPETQAPATDAPDEEIAAWCTKWRIPSPSTNETSAKFVFHAREHDRRCRDWRAAWLRWEANEARFAARGPRPSAIRQPVAEELGQTRAWTPVRSGGPA